MDKAAREARNAYRRAYYRANRDKYKAQQERYWTRKAAKMAEAAEAETQPQSTPTIIE